MSTKKTAARKPTKSLLKAPAEPPRPAAKASSPGATARKASPASSKSKAPAAKKTAAAKRPTAKAGSGAMARRADFGAPIDGFIAKQAPERRALLEKLRGLILAAAPDAVSALKWGMPAFSVGGRMMCAIGVHKAHANLILAGGPEMFPDPDERLEGEGKTGRRLVLRSLADLPEKAVRGWLKAAADGARKG